MTWDPRYTQRVSDLVHKRGLDPEIGRQLNMLDGRPDGERLLAEIEQAADADIAEVNRLFRLQSSTQQGETA